MIMKSWFKCRWSLRDNLYKSIIPSLSWVILEDAGWLLLIPELTTTVDQIRINHGFRWTRWNIKVPKHSSWKSPSIRTKAYRLRHAKHASSTFCHSVDNMRNMTSENVHVLCAHHQRLTLRYSTAGTGTFPNWTELKWLVSVEVNTDFTIKFFIRGWLLYLLLKWDNTSDANVQNHMSLPLIWGSNQRLRSQLQISPGDSKWIVFTEARF